MRPEDQLDRLIEQRHHGENRPLFLDDETTAFLEAAEKLTQLRQIDVPSQFARTLEEEIRARVRAQNVSEQSQRGKILPFMPTQHSRRPARSLGHRVRVISIACAAVLLIICTSLLTVSLHNAPRDPLSSQKPTATQTTSDPAQSPQARANAAIQQLHRSIVDLRTVVNDGQNDKVVRQALETVSTWTSTSQKQVAGLPVNSELSTIQHNLALEITDEEQTLHLLLTQVHWSMKVAFTRQLGILGEPVPTVASVTVHVENSGAVLVTLLGTHFSSGAQLVVDGKAMGSVSQNTAKKLVAIIGNAWHLSGTHMFGVLNPDGTAAQVSFTSSGTVNGSGTPTPTPTHRPDE